MARKPRFHGLKKPKIRASWNKYNLYNISRMRLPNTAFRTFFQQKWSAKSATRAYHGPFIREKQWQQMFSPNLRAVVPMDHRYLAEFDGSELAEGRGSGKEKPPGKQKNGAEAKKAIPYMQMTYAPMERRLDMAIFRSLFASSHKQARQMVVHGHVKVNGRKMIYPGYLLNPGDMYLVDPEVVQYATSDSKNSAERFATRQYRRRSKAISKARAAKAAARMNRATLPDPTPGSYNDEPKLGMRQLWLRQFKRLFTLVERGYTDPLGNTRQLNIRYLKLSIVSKSIRKLVGKWNEMPWPELKSAMEKIAMEYRGAKIPYSAESPARKEWLRIKMDSRKTERDRKRRLESKKKGIEEKVSDMKAAVGRSKPSHGPISAQIPGLEKDYWTPRRKALQMREIRQLHEVRGLNYTNPSLDRSKRLVKKISRKAKNPHLKTASNAYPVPFRPKPYMSAFAFIPRYLEVRQHICAGVYLRHPVARPGLAEVPSPFPMEVNQLAFNWYLRRR